MKQRHGVALLVRETPPPLWVGALVAVLAVALCTALLYPLKTVAPVVSLGVVYLLAVMMVSANWGLVLGVPTSLASAAAFNWFHIPPVGRFTVGDPQNWVALAAFVVAAIMASAIAQAFRDRAADALERRREADLAAEMARVLLRGEDTGRALDEAAAHLAAASMKRGMSAALRRSTSSPTAVRRRGAIVRALAVRRLVRSAAGDSMRGSMSLEERAALVRIEPRQIEDWSSLGLLDPAETGRFDHLDLLRLMTIRHYEALDYCSGQCLRDYLAAAPTAA
jgi:K+-sensing histidine kinase KdpD